MTKVKKVFLSLVLSVLIFIPAMLLLTACGEFSLSMRLTVGENIKDYIKDVNMVRMTASQPDFEQPVYVSEDTSYKGKTADVLIEFVDGYQPKNAVITVNGENFTDFAVKTYTDNEFSNYIEFSLPCKKGDNFEITLNADGFEEIEKTYAININVPLDGEEPVTTDFAGREYLKEISILSFKEGEQTPKYHTLDEIAGLDKDASQRVQFKAYMKVDRPTNDYVPIFYVRSATQYINAFLESSSEPDKTSVISNVFKVGDYNLYISQSFYDSVYNAIEEVKKGNLHLSVEQDKLISGRDTLYIDPTALLSEFNKVYRVEPSTEKEFSSISWGVSTTSHNYGEEQTLTLTPSVGGTAFAKENVDLSEAKVYVNGIEMDGERFTRNLEGAVHSLTFKLGKDDTSNYINGQKTNDVTGKMIFEVRNIKLRDITNGHLLVWEYPTWWDENAPLNNDLAGQSRNGDLTRFTYIIGDREVGTADKTFKINFHKFGYQSFKLQMTAPNGDVYTTDLIDALSSDTQDLTFKKDGSANSFVTAEYYFDAILVEFGRGQESVTWEQMNGYKFEFVDATPVTDEIKLELAFDGVTSFKVNDEDVEFANGATIEYSKKYEIQGVATDAQFAAGDIYHLNYKLFDAEGNELNRLNYGEFLTFSYGYYNDYQIETAGQIPFDIGFEMASHCKVAQGENGNLVKIAKIVFSLAK